MTREIPLTQGMVALVDDDDYAELSKYKWCAYKNRNTYYAVRHFPMDLVTHKQGTIKMHAIIAGTPKGMETDHINGNGLDNRRENLRIVTHRQNGQNRHQIKSSKYPGVSWDSCRKKWKVRTRVNGKLKYLGYYEDEETAGIVYAMACNALNMGCVL